MAKEVTVVCHGDGDGLIAAAVAVRHYGGSPERLVLTQPFLLDKIGQVQGPFVVVDIAVNNRDVEMTRRFIQANREQIIAWWDHHQGYEMLREVLDEAAKVGQAPSCPALMEQMGIDVPVNFVAAANACDRPTDYPSTPLSELINGAMKVALIESDEKGRGWVDRVQKAIVTNLVTGQDPEGLVAETAGKYSGLLEATKSAAEKLAEVAPGVLACSLTGGELVDKTALFMEGYKRAAVIALQYVSKETEEPVTTIATSRKDLNLVQAFGLASGASFRVTIVGGDHQSQLERVKTALAGKVA